MANNLKRPVNIKKIPDIYQKFQRNNEIKNLSKHTITYYYWNLKHLFDFLCER